MTFALGAGSRKELVGVHPKLIAVVERAIAITKQDFTVHDGLRTMEEQRELVRKGASKTMDSKHRKQADGFGHAVDLVPFVNGKLRWEWPTIFQIAAAVRQAAVEQGTLLIWGGIWDRPFEQLAGTPADLEKAVTAYVDRRRKLGKSAFLDGPHYQLAE